MSFAPRRATFVWAKRKQMWGETSHYKSVSLWLFQFFLGSDFGKETPHEFFTVIQNGLFLARFVFEFLNLRFLFDVCTPRICFAESFDCSFFGEWEGPNRFWVWSLKQRQKSRPPWWKGLLFASWILGVNWRESIKYAWIVVNPRKPYMKWYRRHDMLLLLKK